MSILPQLTFSTGCQLPPAAPSSLFEIEDNAFCPSGRSAASCSKNSRNNGSGKQSNSGSSKSSSNSKSRAAAGLRGMRAAEETLQWLAARVLQQAPPPHMLPLSEVFEKVLRLDAVAASQALLHITRNIAKVLQASRLLFVGNRAACQQYLAQRLEEERQRLALEQQHQQRSVEQELVEKESQQDGDKSEKRWDGEEIVASWEQHVDAEKDASGQKEGNVKSEEDADDWNRVPLRDEQSSCFPWLVPNAAVAAAAEAQAAEVLSCNHGSAASKRRSEEAEEESTADEAEDHLFVLLQPVSPAEEAFGCPDVLIKLCNFLSVQDVISVGRVCRATVQAALSEDVWMPLLQRSFPKASLVNEDALESAEEQQRIDEEKHKQILDDMLVQIPPDKPVSLAALLLSANKTLAADAAATACGGELRLRMDAEALLHLLSCHPDTFKQDAAGQQFVVQPSRLYSDWLPVNPYAVANWGPERTRQLQQETRALWREEQCEAGAVNLQQEHQEREPPPQRTAEDDQSEADLIFRRDLSARQAYRLWHTKLLGAEQNRERPWEYFNACSEISSATKSLVHKRGLLLPAGSLLDLCERRLRFVRLEDPVTVHTLVLRTLDGIMYHIPSGCFNRRVNLLQQALCSPHLRLERETRKRIERRLLDFMQHVRNERKFGFFACRSCGSRWRSGFTYDEIAQQCLRCGLWNKAFKCQPLRSAQDLGALQKNPAAPLQSQQLHSDALLHQQHQPDTTAQQQQHVAQQQREVTGVPQHQQQEARHLQQVQHQHRGGRQQRHQRGGLPRQHQQRLRQQQHERSPREPHQFSSAVLQQPELSSEAEHDQSYATEQDQQYRRQPPQHPCDEEPRMQEPRCPSRSARPRQERPRGTVQHTQDHRGPAALTAVDKKQQECAVVLEPQQPSLRHADQDRQQVKHVQQQDPPRTEEERQREDRSTRGKQGTRTGNTRQKVRATRDPAQTRGLLPEPLLCVQSRLPPDPLLQQQEASQLLSSSRGRRWQAIPDVIEYGKKCSDESVKCSSGRRAPAKGQQHDVRWNDVQHQERKHEERNRVHRSVSQGLLPHGLGQRGGPQDAQQHQNQSRKPFRRNGGRTEEGRGVREDRRDVSNGVSYDSRSELVRRVLHQQLRSTAREERL